MSKRIGAKDIVVHSICECQNELSSGTYPKCYTLRLNIGHDSDRGI